MKFLSRLLRVARNCATFSLRMFIRIPAIKERLTLMWVAPVAFLAGFMAGLAIAWMQLQ